jgi:small subunit ribosomal protein S1
MAKHDDLYKEKFRPDADSALDREIEAALGGLNVEDLVGKDQPKPAQGSGAAATPKGSRHGRIVRISKEDVFVDFGGKSQGICSLIEFVDVEEPKVGQEMDFVVERFDDREGILVLHRKGALATNVSWENLEVGQVVEGTVSGVNKGGLEVEVKGMRAFMPAGQVDIYHVPDLSQFLNQKIQAEVTQFEKGSRNLIISRRNVIEQEREGQKKKLLEELAEGQIRRGTVRSVMDFGAFVDLGGMDGLLHVSEMSFQRGRHSAADFVKTGDVVDVKVLKIDREAGKLSLSLKQARGVDPWADAGTKYAVGTTLTGRVAKVENFGVFIEVEEGVEGLLPVSEMSYTRIKHPSDMAKEGDTLKLVVISVDPAQRRMSFSLKQAGPDPWKTVGERYATGTVVDGTVTRTVDFGAFVELEAGLEGLVHVSELSDQRVRSPGEVLKPGQAVRVLIQDVDSQARRMSLSLKRVREYELPKAAGAVGAAGAAVLVPDAQQPKKKRPELRGGLDFDYKKNK